MTRALFDEEEFQVVFDKLEYLLGDKSVEDVARFATIIVETIMRHHPWVADEIAEQVCTAVKSTAEEIKATRN